MAEIIKKPLDNDNDLFDLTTADGEFNQIQYLK